MGCSTRPARGVGAHGPQSWCGFGRGRAVEVEDAAAHVGIGRRRHLQGAVVAARPRPSSPAARSSTRQRVLRLEERLAVARRLPELGEVVPLVVGVGDVADVGGPRAQPVAVGGGDAEREPGAPVVAHEVDRARRSGRARRAASRRSRPWWPRSPPGAGCRSPGSDERHRLAVDALADAVPDGGGLGDAVHEDDHGADAIRRGQTAPVAAISTRALGRTLLARQHLLDAHRPGPRRAWWSTWWGCRPRSPATPTWRCGHASTASSRPTSRRRCSTAPLVRMVAMRGTIHLLTADDALRPAPPVPAGARPGDGPPLAAQGRPRRASTCDPSARSPASCSSSPLSVPQPAGPPSPSASPSTTPRPWRSRAATRCRSCRRRRAGCGRASGAVAYVAAEHWLGRAGATRRRSTSVAAPLPRGVRPGHRRRLRDVDPPHPAPRGLRAAAARGCAPGRDEHGRELFDVADGEITDDGRAGARPVPARVRQRAAVPRRPEPDHRRAAARPVPARRRWASATSSSTAGCRPPGGSTRPERDRAA